MKSGGEGILGHGEWTQEELEGINSLSYGTLLGVIVIAAVVILGILGWTGVVPAQQIELMPGFISWVF